MADKVTKLVKSPLVRQYSGEREKGTEKGRHIIGKETRVKLKVDNSSALSCIMISIESHILWTV